MAKHWIFKGRTALATTGLAALTAGLLVSHQSQDTGLAAEEITPELQRQALEDAVRDLGAATVASHLGDAFLLDLVEPGDGEGGSEEAIAAYVAELDARSDLSVDKAGVYSEGEHLYRVELDERVAPQTLAALFDHALVEGYEQEVFYTLPEQALSAYDGPAPDRDIHKPTPPETFTPDDPMFSLQWHMQQIRAPEAWTKNRGKGAVVAVIDSGVAWASADGVKAVPDLAGTKMVDGETFIKGAPGQGLDDHAHGTHVAGTIAQTTDNGVGVTGVAFESTIMPLKVLSKEGRGGVGDIANAIRYAADHGAHVINMSLGGPLPSSVLGKAIEYAHSKGVTVVAAAGNEKRGRVGHPAAHKFAVAVGAVNYDRELAFYSNYGKAIDVTAPGGDTRADRNGDGHPDGVLQNTIQIQRPLENDYLWFQGTSMASPHAAGVAALIVSEGVTNPNEVERIMKETAVHPQGKAWDKYFGAGIVDAAAAVDRAKASYAPERGGLGALLGFMALGGLGMASLRTRRGRAFGLAGLGAAFFGASGALGTEPLAYALASAAPTMGLGAGLALSAAVPFVASVLFLGLKPLRSVLTGLSLGYAALLAHGAIVLPTLLTELPGGPGIDRLWLGANAVLALVLARRVSRL